MNQCGLYRLVPSSVWDVISIVYLLLAVLNIFLFLLTRKHSAYYLLFFLTVFKFFLLLADYRFMGNYHYMPFLVSFVYLLIPQKKTTILYTIVIFYISAGLLKLDTEWLSGSALLEPFFVGGEMLEWMLAYTIIFEVLVVLLSLSNSILLFLFSFPQIVGFHALSWHIVGYFYPCIMFSLLTSFLLFRWQWSEGKIHLQKRDSLKAGPKIFLILLFLAQVMPRVLSPNLAVDSQGRLFTLNMLDARVQCEHFSYYKGKENIYVETSSDRTDLGTRIACDPIVYTAEAAELCKNQGVEEVPSYLHSKKSTHNEWVQVLQIKNYCDKTRGVTWWGGIQ